MFAKLEAFDKHRVTHDVPPINSEFPLKGERVNTSEMSALDKITPVHATAKLDHHHGC